MPTSAVRAGVDIGGTFTDLAIVQNGVLRVHKVSSTPARPQDGLLSGLADLVPAGEAIDLVHGSTVATNAFLERKGARTAYLGTAGFEETPFLRRQNRRSLYDLAPQEPPPVIGRKDVRAVTERLAADGTVLRALSRAAARRIAQEVATAGYRSAAVCLLFSFRSPCHEDILASELEAAGVEAHRSSEVLPRPGEFERASATLLNAYLSPLVRAYLTDLVERLRPRTFSMMKSSGGRLSAAAASRMGLHTILSGPAGGVVGAMQAAAPQDRLLTFDMGGTSTDVALVDGRPRLARDYMIEGWPVGVPVLDIHTIGAGGGSLARVDRGGSLRVGPGSAGADPGPACYGRGEELTVTDAHVVLGQIPPGRFLGGRMQLYPERAVRAAEKLGALLKLDARAVAAGVLAVVRSNMQRALRAVSVARGYDPADFTLVSFGGAGGLHTFFLAGELGVRRVLVPRWPGALSALGMLASDEIAEAERAVTDRDELDELFAELATRNERELGRTPIHERWVGLAYVGRGDEIVVPWTNWASAVAEFHARHQRERGTSDQAEPVVLRSAQVRSTLAGTPVPYPVLPAAAPGTPAPIAGTARATLGAVEEEVPIFDKAGLQAGMVLDGPAMLCDETATTLVPAGWRLTVGPHGHLLGERSA